MRIITAQNVAVTQWLRMVHVTYADAGGTARSWQLVTRRKQPKCISRRFDPPDAVLIVPFHQTEEKLVITREFRVPLADVEYGFPAGLIERGETLEEAARRELAEETGLTLTGTLHMSPPLYSSAGMTDEAVSVIYVTCDGNPSTRGNTGPEQIEPLMISPEQASDLCNNDELKFDAKAWFILCTYAAGDGSPPLPLNGRRRKSENTP